MCVVCEIKNKLLSEGVSEEASAFILQRVDFIAATLAVSGMVMDSMLQHGYASRSEIELVVKDAKALMGDDDESVAYRNERMAAGTEQQRASVTILNAIMGVAMSTGKTKH